MTAVAIVGLLGGLVLIGLSVGRARNGGLTTGHGVSGTLIGLLLVLGGVLLLALPAGSARTTIGGLAAVLLLLALAGAAAQHARALSRLGAQVRRLAQERAVEASRGAGAGAPEAGNGRATARSTSPEVAE